MPQDDDVDSADSYRRVCLRSEQGNVDDSIAVRQEQEYIFSKDSRGEHDCVRIR